MILSLFKPLGCLGLLISLSTLTLSATARESAHQSPNNSASDNTERVCPQNLPLAINEIINHPQLARSRWGIHIKTIESQQTLYSLEADKYFIPASSAKLLTTAAALVELGADFRIATPVSAVGDAPNLTSLRLEGRGDPSLSVKSLEALAHQLQERGIKRIQKLIVEDSYFTQPSLHPTWEWLDIYSYYATAVNSLILDRNTVTLTLLPQQLGEPVKLKWSNALAAKQWRVENNAITAPKDTEYNVTIDGVLGEPVLKINGELALDNGSDIWDLAIANPANYFLESWRLILAQAGIQVTQGIVVSEAKNNQLDTKIATFDSPPLSRLLREINQESNNLYAEVILKLLHKKLNTDNSIEALQQSLSKLNIKPQDYSLVDGSGLSRHNLLTPKVLVQILNLMANSAQSKIYQNSLAVAGKSGTLKKRFQDTEASGNLWAKTGTLNGVGALAGYLKVSNYETLALSIIVNNSELSSKEIRQAIDRIVILLSQLQQC